MARDRLAGRSVVRTAHCVPAATSTPPYPRAALNADRTDSSSREAPRTPLREHVATSIQRYLGDLNGNDTDNLYEVALRELEIPLFVEVLNFCEGNQSRAAAMLGIHRATLRKKLREYGLT